MAPADNHGWESAPTPVIETASATTSPENENSGNTAYIIAAVAIAALAVFGMGLSTLLNLGAHLVEQEVSSYLNDDGLDYPYGDLDGQTESPYDLIEEYFNGPKDYGDLGIVNERGVSLDQDKDGRLTVNEALGANLGIYAKTVDAKLPQSSYANAQNDVRTFVRELVLMDRDSSSALATKLQPVAWKEGDVKGKLKESLKDAEVLIKELQDMRLPTLPTDGDKDIAKSLESGKGKVVERWQAVLDELKLIDGAETDELDESEVKKAEEKVATAAEEAAEALSKAMVDSAQR